MVTMVIGEPSASADSVAWVRSSGPALSRPIVNDGTAWPRSPRAEPEDDRRVEAARDVADDRHVAPEPTLDGLAEHAFELVDHRRRVVHPAFVAAVGEVEVPVPLHLDPAILHLEEVARRERLDPLEERARAVPAQKNEKRWSTPFGSGRAATSPDARIALTSEPQSSQPSRLGVIERADADAVAAEDQGAVGTVPERDGELAARLGEHPFAVVLVEVDPGLGVAAGAERVAAGEEFLAEFGVFEQLAVERDPDDPRRSLGIGCRPPARSTIESRVAPRATPGSTWTCWSSGPRWMMAAVIAWSRTGRIHESRSGRTHLRCRTYSPRQKGARADPFGPCR